MPRKYSLPLRQLITLGLAGQLVLGRGDIYPTTILHQVHSTEYTPLSVLHHVYSTVCTSPSVFHRVYSTECIPTSVFHRVYSTKSTPSNKLHQLYSTEYAPSSILHRVHSIEYTPPSTLHRVHSTKYAPPSTLDRAYSIEYMPFICMCLPFVCVFHMYVSSFHMYLPSMYHPKTTILEQAFQSDRLSLQSNHVRATILRKNFQATFRVTNLGQPSPIVPENHPKATVPPGATVSELPEELLDLKGAAFCLGG